MTDSFLAKIAAAKREEVAVRFDGASLDALRSAARPTRRSLSAAIAQDGARFILEVKKASPSFGPIRPSADVPRLARGYAAIADALSILCDATFFGGSLEDLMAARREFDGPILAKDFFIDLRQVAEARIAGADAILVLLSLLDDEAARSMIAEAARLGMEALVEVHDEREMGRALALGGRLIGINNRDLADLSIDLTTSERLARLAANCLAISESGISSRRDVDRLAPFVDGFLVGSSLMRAPDPAIAARELMFGRIKLCGLKRPEDFDAARAATYVGLIFVPESPRAVSLGEALPLATLHPRPVGIFRNASLDEVGETASMLGLAAVQIHGDEDASYVRALARRLPAGCEIWKAVQVDRSPPDRFDAADRLLFDSGPGGTGKPFDWSLLRDHPDLDQALIAGGIGPHNARSAQRLGGFAIDVGSALDANPGRKSVDKIAALFDAVRPTSHQALRACA